MKICRMDDCQEPKWKRELCKLHYGREWHAGRLPPITPLDRFLAFVDLGDCWEWRGTRTQDGYGRFRHGRLHLAHRWIWEHLVGPIPDGHEVDHLCKNPSCVNPDHLEPVTPRENWLRSDAPTVRNAAKTHCLRGHKFTPENTRNAGGGRACIACQIYHSQKRRSA